MSSVTRSTRKRIDAVADELIAISKAVRPFRPTLADAYSALGCGIDASHYQVQGDHYFNFDIPANCFITVAGRTTEGPTTLSIHVRQ